MSASKLVEAGTGYEVMPKLDERVSIRHLTSYVAWSACSADLRVKSAAHRDVASKLAVYRVEDLTPTTHLNGKESRS